MLKTLFKKQFAEINSWLIVNKKSGERRSTSSMLLFGLIYAFALASIGFMFFTFAGVLCGPLAELNMSWLYFALMGIMSVLLGVFGSVFNTYSTLYLAKDNDLLLSLPIPTHYILVTRLFGVWIWGTVFEAVVFIPTLIVYWLNCSPTVLSVIISIAVMLLMSLFILAVSCVLGYIVAVISSKLKNKSFITVLVSLLFFAGYYYLSSQSYSMLNKILENAVTVGVKIKGAAYPLYLMGRAAQGEVLPTLLLTLIIAVIFAAVYFLLSRSFLKMATANHSAAKRKYKQGEMKLKSADAALLSKEFKRFLSSPNYMLNCGLGTVFLIVLGVAAVIKSDMLTGLLSQYSELKKYSMLLVCSGICMAVTMNDITAPSVSLEGKNIWIAQSLPVSPWSVLKAKLGIHLILTLIPSFICSCLVAFSLRFSLAETAVTVVLPMLFTLLTASFGLAVNLKMPNLNWTNEAVPLKQSAGVFLALFGGWAVIVLFAVLCYLLRNLLSPVMISLLCGALLAGSSAALVVWLKNKGSKIFSSL